MSKNGKSVIASPKSSRMLPGKYASVKVSPDVTSKSPSELAQQLSSLCIDIYLSGKERFIPLPPFVLVRVLPKDMVTDGGIVLPNEKQNKPVHEGIVLETYRPYTEEVVLKKHWDDDGTTEEYIGTITRECPLQRGQRVAYPHYEGIPHKYLGDDYVLVRHAADQIKFPYCQVLGIIDNAGDYKIANKIRDLLRQYYSVTISGAAASRGENE